MDRARISLNALRRVLRLYRFDPKGRTAKALRYVLVNGLNQSEAARRAGLDPAAVNRALARIQEGKVCPYCGSTHTDKPTTRESRQ